MVKHPKGERRLSRGAKISLVISTLIVIIGIPTAVQGMTFTEGEPPTTVTISLFQSILIGLGYYLSQSPWIAGLSFWTLYRPLVAGLIVGLILGDPGQVQADHRQGRVECHCGRAIEQAGEVTGDQAAQGVADEPSVVVEHHVRLGVDEDVRMRRGRTREDRRDGGRARYAARDTKRRALQARAGVGAGHVLT